MTHVYIDIKYVGLMSVYLEMFQKKSDFLWNFRCPVCGDSKKKKNKARGYIYKSPKSSSLNFKCHNCNSGMKLGNFIKFVNEPLYNQYIYEKFKDDGKVVKVEDPKPTPKVVSYSKIKIPTINSLPSDHPAKKYLLERQIPQKYLDIIFYTDKFATFANSICDSDRYKKLQDDERIVIPFFNRDGKIVGGQGRCIGNKSSIRYITFRKNDDINLLYGLERWRKASQTYVVEGPLDSLFLPNCLAAANSSLHTKINNLKKYHTIDLQRITLVFDNEPRNKEIIKTMKDSITNNYQVVIWPENIKSKDLNDMVVKEKISKKFLLNIIKENTYSGIKASLKLNSWKKINA